ncbi:hypothetical protein N9J30_00365 [Gammaproteobacteria bacterium]|nr:hypothetical protein [Gammaproteobacteria bacterium]
MSLAKQIKNQIISNLSLNSDNQNVTLNNALRLLSKWRSTLIQNTLLQHEGAKVIDGPLKGLDFIEKSAEGCHVAKILGCYEQPLQPYVRDAINEGYSTVLNIGCAEGYYAVGLARLMPETISLAFDTNPHAQVACRALAAKNNVDDRVKVGGIFIPTDFENYKGESVLIFCDIEGAEDELLNIDLAPSLSFFDIIVESHECLKTGLTQRLMSRFENTHEITLVEDNGLRMLENLPNWFNKLSHLDQLLATWEWRAGPTPWLVMRSKAMIRSNL